MDAIRDYPSKITTISLIISCFCWIMTSALSFHFRKNSNSNRFYTVEALSKPLQKYFYCLLIHTLPLFHGNSTVINNYHSLYLFRNSHSCFNWDS